MATTIVPNNVETGHNTNQLLLPGSVAPDENVGSIVSNRNGQITEIDLDTAHHAVIEIAEPQLQQT